MPRAANRAARLDVLRGRGAWPMIARSKDERRAMPTEPSRRGNETLDRAGAEALRADLLRFLGRRTRDPALAEDLAQQALLQLVAALPRFRGAATLRTWARRIATNVWRDHLRRQAGSSTDRPAPAGRRSGDATSDVVDPRAAPAEILDRGATRACLLDAIGRLPLDARRILLLHELGDMPLDAAAAALGCTPGAAKVRLHRARRRLAERCRADCTSDVAADGATLCTPKLVEIAPPPRRAAAMPVARARRARGRRATVTRRRPAR